MNSIDTAYVAWIGGDPMVMIGFTALLGLLVWALFSGKPRKEPSIVVHDPPLYPEDSLYHDANRRKAAAAVTALHQHTHTKR